MIAIFIESVQYYCVRAQARTRPARDSGMVGNNVLRHIFRRHFRSRLDEMVAPNYALLLDYPVKASPRHGYGKPPHPQIAKILEVKLKEASMPSGFRASAN
jgi:hypothetical protein